MEGREKYMEVKKQSKERCAECKMSSTQLQNILLNPKPGRVE